MKVIIGIHGPWRGHIREYVRNDLALLADYLNLEVLELRGCDHMLQKLPSSIRPVYLLLTRLCPGWKDSWLLVARKKEDWSANKTLPKSELARIMGKNTSYDYTK